MSSGRRGPIQTESCITIESVYPATFDTLSRLRGSPVLIGASPDRALVEFFESKGLAALKKEDAAEEWYQDWIDYQAKNKLYAIILSPSRYSSLGRSFSLLTLTRFVETFAFLSPAHAYGFHVTFLGLFPILLSDNEALKVEAIAELEKGGLFAFGVSEKAHGADILANEFSVRPTAHNGAVANGSKYYIGNANCASIISILAKRVETETADKTRRAPFVLFAFRPRQSQAMQNLRKIRTLGVRTAFVGEFDINDHCVADSDVISQGRDAWNAVAATVTLGKFFLGFGAIGVCAHAFAEAIDHLQRRILYGRPVMELPHIRTMMLSAFARLTAMKLYAYRALDYLQVASDSERRFQLFNAVQKAKVSTEGVKVMTLLSECMGARGFEADTYFELALRDVPMIPSLEGSTHINLRLTCQFIENYFLASEADRSSPQSLLLNEIDAIENPHWFTGKERNPKTVPFSDCLRVYGAFRAIVNVRTLLKQIEAFRRFVETGVMQRNGNGDTAILIAVGRCFSTIVFGQLIAEMCHKAHVPSPMVSLIFAGIVEDLSTEALRLAACFRPGSAERSILRKLVRIHRTTEEDLRSVWDLVARRYAR